MTGVQTCALPICVLAARLLQENSKGEVKIKKAFRLIICRNPSEKEIMLLTSYYSDQLKVFKQNSNAEKVLAVGEYPIPAKINKIALAALMGVITTIYNLEETMTKT